MNLKHKALSFFAAAVLAAATHAVAGESSFAALSQVDAQALSAQEMRSVTGELNAYQIADNLKADGDKALAAGFPRLANALYALSAATLKNATALNDYFTKIGVFTPYP
jgi:hypothetical protein